MYKSRTAISVAVIIPTLAPLSRDRLDTLFRRLGQIRKDIRRLRVILVVNDMPPSVGSKILATVKKSNVEVLFSGINKGFAQAVNDGICYARVIQKPDWYFVLNDDAIPSRRLINCLSMQLCVHQYDAISCKVLTRNKRIESVGLMYSPTGLAFPRRRDIHDEETPLFTGTATFLSSERVERELSRCGYIFNPLFFAYAEDLELSLRILRDNGKIFITNECLIEHMGSQTAHRGSYIQLYHGYRNFLVTMYLMWKSSAIVLRLPLILAGQVYVMAISIWKGYFLLYPKIWWWIIQNRKSIAWQKRLYEYNK